MTKRIIVILGIFTIILIFVVYLLYNYNIGIKKSQSFNRQYEQYYHKEILGTDLATLLNKVSDYNEKNNVEKDENNRYYIEKDNSILIDIKFSENEDIFRMEDILSQDIQNFIKYYATSNFKCTKIEYHEDTKKIKSMFFMQI